MAITADAVMLAEPRADASQARRYVLSHPNGRYLDDEVREIVNLYFDVSTPVGLDPVLPISQMCLETGHLSSKWAQVPRRNPAGIGVTGLEGQGLSFPSWAVAVRAHVGRLLAYVLPRNRGSAAQVALIEEALSFRPLPNHLRGAAPALKNFGNGIWAADPGYSRKIVGIANKIISEGTSTGGLCPRPHPLTTEPARGEAVLHLQDLLVRAGHDLSQEGGINGVFGSGLTREVKAFQAFRGLQDDGKVGTITWAALHQAVGEFA